MPLIKIKIQNVDGSLLLEYLLRFNL